MRPPAVRKEDEPLCLLYIYDFISSSDVLFSSIRDEGSGVNNSRVEYHLFSPFCACVVGIESSQWFLCVVDIKSMEWCVKEVSLWLYLMRVSANL
jgi:hypothetical protein